MKSIIFDLDGTLTDSSEGITKCAQLALNHFGIYKYTLEELKVFIGPPLQMSFPKFGVPVEKVDEAIKVFRSRYTTVGKYENKPFKGIRELLERLSHEGYRLFIGTSKPEQMAIDILNHFELADYFEVIAGATFDHSRESKEAVLSYLLEQVGSHEALMIGDTVFDVEGAKALGIETIGVDWGFGHKEEMLAAGALCVVSSMNELYNEIVKN